MPTSEIRELTNHFVEQLLPVRIYLFGSFADSTYTEESDFDFYIIVHDAISDIPAETTKAYKSIRKVKQRPVDIVVGTVSRFEARKEIPSTGNEVYVLICECILSTKNFKMLWCGCFFCGDATAALFARGKSTNRLPGWTSRGTK